MYVTHAALPDEEVREVPNVRDTFYGDELTYIPAAQVRKVRMRLIRSPAASAAEVAGPQAGEEEAP